MAAGHPLLFLDDAKAPNYRKNNGFKDLGNYFEWPKVAGAVIKTAPDLHQGNHAVLQVVQPEHVTVERCRSEELDRRRGRTSALDAMWSYVRSKANPRWW